MGEEIDQEINTDVWAMVRIETILSRPGMWGSMEAVEAQVLTLVEMLRLPDDMEVLERWRAHCQACFPKQPSSLPVFAYEEISEEEHMDVLKSFWMKEKASLLSDDEESGSDP